MIIAEDTKKGRVFIMASERGLPPSVIKREGKWTTGDFTADDLNANFTVVTSTERIEELIKEVRIEKKEEARAEAAPKKLTNIQKIKMIEEVLEREIRPALRKDGGDIELIDVDGDFVMVSLRGACVSCVASQTTLKEYVEKKLREQVLDTLIVEEVKS